METRFSRYVVTSVAVLENMSQIAVGLENGVVILVRGDISRDRFTKQKVIHEGSACITEGKTTTLYIVTLAKILSCVTSSKEVTTTTLDDQGCDFGCAIATPQEQNQEMVIARKEAIYFYGLDGRGPCFIFDNDKTFITWFRNYLAVVSRESRPTTTPKTNTLAEMVGHTSTGAVSAATSSALPEGTTSVSTAGSSELIDTSGGTVLTLYDLKNKYIAYQGSFPGPSTTSSGNGGYVAATKAVEKVFKVTPDFTREGGSIPVTLTFQEALGKNVLLLPMGKSDDGAHSINEKIDKLNYIEGIKLLTSYMHEIGTAQAS
ncbi:Vacuolar protein sorting-associated protein 11 [Quaeritorhiza haematococci]|nr:Vacuolar protein sorting-associated protein 11 [Quaeritorhiza haematococci]